jgi:coenzyme F420-reducing hydrogenase beta subunit
MIQINKQTDCCGCSACEAICPKDAIIMRADDFGFKYPRVDLDKCIDCHLCEKVCQFNSNYDKSQNLEKPLAYGVRHKNPEEVASSRSGAAFIAISDVILRKGGIVYGVGYQDNFVVSHIKATDVETRNKMKGSKYVQSNLDGIFKSVKEDLKQNRLVLFSGTPCQVAGLKSYVGNKLAENLFLVDIVCHGVPSPKVWAEYLVWLKKKWNTSIDVVNFRDKRFGWRVHKESYVTKNGLKYCNSFTRAFYKGLIIRQSCGACPFANTSRPSDLTLADFWGWEKNAPEWNKDDLGLSLVLVNTPKGKAWLAEAEAEVDARQFKLENCLQNQLKRPLKLNPESLQFQKLYAEKGFDYTMRKFNCIGIGYKVYSILSNMKQSTKKALGR